MTTLIGAKAAMKEKLKSFDKLELIALISDVAVEMIAAKIAQPTKAETKGVVSLPIVVISTLAPVGTSIPICAARIPKKTGITQTAIVQRPAKSEALETT